LFETQILLNLDDAWCCNANRSQEFNDVLKISINVESMIKFK